MFLRSVKQSRLYRELYYIRRAWAYYKKLGPYLRMRFVVGPRILKSEKPLDRPVLDGSYSVHFLCSHRDLLLLVWSLKSWHDVVSRSAQVYIHEDGSFTARDRAHIARLFPHAAIVDHDGSTEQARSQWLKASPKARSYRTNEANVLMVKLIDPYFTGNAPMRLILDTDMLWFAEPTDILAALAGRVDMPFMMKARQGIFRLGDGTDMPQELSDLNSGIVGYRTGDFDLGMVEEFFTKGTKYNHFIEQACYAWVLSKKSGVIPLDPKKYVIKEDAAGSVMKHFTGPRREEFWFEGVALLSSKS